MANRRMFSRTITSSSKFLRMPATSRLLYYDLGMNADDDGFVEWYGVIAMTGGREQDMQVLQANDFVKVFDDQVLVILDWKENNYLRNDRYQPSKYLKIYPMDTIGIPLVYQVDTQDRIGKDREELHNTTNVVADAPPTSKKNETFRYWEETIAPVTTGIESHRKSSVTLQNKYGQELCEKMIRVVAHAHQNQYARKEVKCTSLTSLLGNWDKVYIYAKSQSAKPVLEIKKGVPSV